MKTAAAWHAGSASDAGLERNINEDRVFVDETRGLFMVVDGLGGHAAGETAAQTAVEVIDWELRGPQAIDAERIANAITTANNKIYSLSEANAAWRGMACVLTLAAASGDQFLIGHVGDSRLYLYWNGKLQKLTADHSPVGELEDAGELTEDQAMRHPRRNEVFRDVGSFVHSPDDPQFIELKSFRFRSDAALLICSDGLTDLVKSAEIARILERYDGDAERIALLLVEAANAAGGRDNISVVFVPGPDFLGTESATLAEGRSRHATTRMRPAKTGVRALLRNALFVIVGMLLAFAIWRVVDRYQKPPAPPAPVSVVAPHVPQEIRVAATDPQGILKALAVALPGDTIRVAAGEYVGPLVLKDRVNVIGQSSHLVVVRSDPSATAESGLAVVARGIKEGHLKGLHVVGDAAHPLRIGLLIADSSIEVEDVEIAGATDAGLRIDGDSHPLVIDGNFHANAGPGVVVRGRSVPRLLGNVIAENGRVAGAPHAGIEIDNEAQPTLLRNEIVRNGLPAVFPLALDDEIRAKNKVDAGPVKKAPVKPAKPALTPPAPGLPSHAPSNV